MLWYSKISFQRSFFSENGSFSKGCSYLFKFTRKYELRINSREMLYDFLMKKYFLSTNYLPHHLF